MPLAQNHASILLPTMPSAAPLPDAVLFAFDDRAFPFRQNVECQLIPGQHPRLVLRHGEEGAHDEVLRYGGAVLRIGDLFHMWYQGNYGPPANEIGCERTNACLCYAFSADGVVWEKPSLGLMEFNGSTQNNIVDLPVSTLWGSAAVLFDLAETDPQRRFKLAYQSREGNEPRFCVAFSGDGFHWRPSPRNPVGPALEVTGLTRHHDLYYACGHLAGAGGRATQRQLVSIASADFEHWSPCGAMGLDRAGEAADAHAFGEEVHLGAGLWHRGNVLLAVYGQWHGHATGDRRLVAIDLGLALSHDGIKYHEPSPGFRLIPAREQPHSPTGVAPALLQGQGMENHGEQTLCWYSLWRGMRGSGVRLVTWQRDRLGMLRACQPWDAQAITCPFEIVNGRGRAAVNVSGLGEYSTLRVELLDEGFRPIPRYSGADAAVIQESGLRVPLHWAGGDLLLPSHGLVRLAIRFDGVRPEDARLHAVYLGE